MRLIKLQLQDPFLEPILKELLEDFYPKETFLLSSDTRDYDLMVSDVIDFQSFNGLPLIKIQEKPFHYQRLIEQLLVDSSKITIAESNLFYNKKRKLLKQGDLELNLTEKEEKLLLFLNSHLDKFLKRKLLMEELWGVMAETDTHVIETHIYRLRKKLDCFPILHKHLEQQDGAYRLRSCKIRLRKK